MENLKFLQVPRNVAGYGKLELFYKSPGTWQGMETLIKKKRAPNESTFSRPKTLRGVSYRCPVSKRVPRVPPKNVATGPGSQNLR